MRPSLSSTAACPVPAPGGENTCQCPANFVCPPITAVRDTLWLGAAPAVSDVIYLAVAAVVALALGAFAFNRVDDRIAIEL